MVLPMSRAPAPCKLTMPEFVQLLGAPIESVLVGPTFTMPPAGFEEKFVKASVPPGLVALIVPAVPLSPILLNALPDDRVPAPCITPSFVGADEGNVRSPSIIIVP